MTITHVKAMVAKVGTVGLLAAAVVMAAPQKAQAQVAFGVRVGPVVAYSGPVYGRPVPPAYGYYNTYAPGFYAHEAFERRQAEERREAFARHEYFEHHDFDRRDDHRDWDRR